MLSVRKLFSAAVAFLALTAVAQTASAATVKYTTSGFFTPGGGSSLTVVGTTQLTFEGGTFVVDAPVNPSVKFSFGSFKLSGPTPIPDDTLLGQFTLQIALNEPTVDNSGLPMVADIFGNVGVQDGALVFTFSPSNSTLGGSVKFTPDTQTEVLLNTVGRTSLMGTVQALPGTPPLAPLPAAVWGGIALFGLVGASKVRRAKQLA